jgi:DNA-binding phage protein
MARFYAELDKMGTGATEIAKQERVGRSTVYKLLKEVDGPQIEPKTSLV